MKKDEGLDVLFDEEVVSDKALDTLGQLVRDYKDQEAVVAEKTQELKDEAEKLRKLSQDTIPAMIMPTGFKSLVLSTGEKVTVTEEVKASIAKTKMVQARKDMVELEMKMDKGCTEDLAKSVINTLFKDSLVIQDPTPEMEQLLIDNNIIFDKPSAIHWQTLRKYCVGIEERGEKTPETITVFKYNETKIK